MSTESPENEKIEFDTTAIETDLKTRMSKWMESESRKFESSMLSRSQGQKSELSKLCQNLALKDHAHPPAPAHKHDLPAHDHPEIARLTADLKKVRSAVEKLADWRNRFDQ